MCYSGSETVNNWFCCKAFWLSAESHTKQPPRPTPSHSHSSRPWQLLYCQIHQSSQDKKLLPRINTSHSWEVINIYLVLYAGLSNGFIIYKYIEMAGSKLWYSSSLCTIIQNLVFSSRPRPMDPRPQMVSLGQGMSVARRWLPRITTLTRTLTLAYMRYTSHVICFSLFIFLSY